MNTKTLIFFMAVFLIVSCNDKQPDQQMSEEAKIINGLMADCQNFNTKDITQGLQGVWNRDSTIMYDKEWRTITKIYQLMGVWHMMGGSSQQYTFADNGKCSKYEESSDPNIGSRTYLFEWYYDSESRILSLIGEDYSEKFYVSGYNNEYIVLDYTNEVGNIRCILRRTAE